MNIRKQAAVFGTAAAVGATAITVALVAGVESGDAAAQSGNAATTTGQGTTTSVAPSAPSAVTPRDDSGDDPTASVGQPAQNAQPQGGSNGS